MKSGAHPIFVETPAASWLTVLLGGALVGGNVVELGGVEPAAREWSAWLLAGLVVVHGVSMAWRWGSEEADLRLPRWPLWAATIVLGLWLAWWHDQAHPMRSGHLFFLAAEAWLLCWVVAVTPGGRALSWGWLLVVVLAAGLSLIAAVGWQARGSGLWLPMERQLPAVWQGHWSGTLPAPAAFGMLMLLAGPVLLVMAGSRHLPYFWRVFSALGGVVMLVGALHTFCLGVWLGVALVAGVLPWVATNSHVGRWVAWSGVAASLVGMAVFLYHSQTPGESWFGPLLAGETPLDATQVALAEAWQHNPWLGGAGATMADLARVADWPQPEGGWSYAFSDWLELAVAWGLGGIMLVAVVLGGLLLAAWSSWARLPFSVAPEAAEELSSVGPMGGVTVKRPHTPEAKVLLAAGALGLSAVAVAMAACRAWNVPAVVFAFAVVAGVVARNVPQRGGSVRLDPATRGVLALCLAAMTALLLVGKVAPAWAVQGKLDEAQALLTEIDAQPNAELLAQAQADLREALAKQPENGPALTGLAWLDLEWARLDPDQFTLYSERAENNALRAAEFAPQAPAPWVVRGLACLLVNRAADACNHLSHALELAPYDPAAQYYASTVLLGETGAGNGPLIMRMLPPRYTPPPSWPPLDGEPAEGARPPP
jgi:hypothetical protein